MSEYAEARETTGVTMTYFFVALFAFITAIVLIAPLRRPALVEGYSWDNWLAILLILTLPWILFFGSFGNLRLAEFLRSKPVRVLDAGLVFPVAWLGREQDVIPWISVGGAGSDFGQSARRFRLLWHVWVVLKDGGILERPYRAGGETDRVLKETIGHLRAHIRVAEGSEVLSLTGKKPVGNRLSDIVWLVGLVGAGLATVVAWSLSFLGAIGTTLAAAIPLIVVTVLTVPCWLWASSQRDLLSLGGGRA